MSEGLDNHRPIADDTRTNIINRRDYEMKTKITKIVLERTLPNGTVKAHPLAVTRREAGISAAYCLYDNGVASKADAQRVSPIVERAAIGEYVDAYGYRFRLMETGH